MLVKKLVIVLSMWGILSASKRAVEKGPLIHEALLDSDPLPGTISELSCELVYTVSRGSYLAFVRTEVAEYSTESMDSGLPGPRFCL